MQHHKECPADPSFGIQAGECRCTDPDLFRGTKFTAEDVDHLDEMILSEKCRSEGLLSLPGLEWVRNMVAARVGVELRPLGWDLRQESDEAA